jgi:hypothetical protein
VGSALRPAVGRGDRLAELAVELREIAVGTLVDLVVELRQADLPVEAYLPAAGNDAAGEVGDALALLRGRRRPGEGLERGGRGVVDAILSCAFGTAKSVPCMRRRRV